MAIASFDIFDTALIRISGNPKSIFFLLAWELYPNDESQREAFYVWRCRAESCATSISDNQEITIEDIYNSEEIKSFPEYSKDFLITAEINVEHKNLIANPYIAELITKHRNLGDKIIFISDMYLPSKVLKQALINSGLADDNDKVFVSCEYKSTKRNGLLYECIKKELTNSDNWVHYGDNLRSDINKAKQHGIKVKHIDTSYNSIEKFILKNTAKSKYSREIKILVGLSRAWRISNHNNEYAGLSGDLTAPAYVSYVKWILNQSSKRQIKRLYFLSRDGYILQKIAEQLSINMINPIELKYLFVSRKSLAPAYLSEFTPKKLLSILDGQTLLMKKVDDVLSKLSVLDEELLNNLKSKLPFNSIRSKEDCEIFIELLFNSNLRYIIQNHCKKAEGLVLSYFKQEGLTENCKSALVDVGWLGTSRLMINDLLKRSNSKQAFSFYFGVRKNTILTYAGNYVSYFYAGSLPTQYPGIIETYMSASPYPSTIGYRSNGNKIVPIFKDGQHFMQTDITKANQEACNWIATQLNKFTFIGDSPLYEWAANVMNIFSEPELLNFKPMVKAGKIDGSDLVTKLSFMQTFNLIFLGKVQTGFDPGSLCLTYGNFLGRIFIKLSNKTKNIRREAFRWYINYIKK